MSDAPNITDWITTVIVLPACIMSIIALVESIKVTKNNTLANIKIKIDTARRQCESLAMEMALLQEKGTEYRIKKKLFESAFEKVINAYEKACRYFFEKKVNQKDFNSRYQKDIIGYTEDFPFILGRYEHIKRYYDKYKYA